MTEFKLSPLVLSSNLRESLLQISATVDLEMFQIVVEHMPSVNHNKPISMLLKLYQDGVSTWG